MATDKQRQFVADIEAAAKAVTMREIKNVRIAEVCDMAGTSPVDMRLFVQRLTIKHEVELMERLHAAFASVDLSPRCITDSLTYLARGQQNVTGPDVDSLELERELLPSPVPKIEPAPKPETPSPIPDAGQILDKMIKLIDPLPERFQRRILNSVCVYFGVVE